MPSRLDNWPRLLGDFIESRRETPFAWGSNDCCLFASDAILAITGEDLAHTVRGTYQSALGAGRILKAAGGVSGLVEASGLPEHALMLSQRGDLILAHMDGEETLGVCVGASVAFAAGAGLTFYPLSECSRSWRVGRGF